jgi:hypothetical protein
MVENGKSTRKMVIVSKILLDFYILTYSVLALYKRYSSNLDNFLYFADNLINGEIPYNERF